MNCIHFLVDEFNQKLNQQATLVVIHGMSNHVLIWYRNDLRIADHEPLARAIKSGAKVMGVYCFNPEDYAETGLGFPVTGGFRAALIRQSVQALKQQWADLGATLWVGIGKPQEVIPDLCRTYNIREVKYHHEVTDEEIRTEQALELELMKIPVVFTGYWGHTLFHPEDLPFPVKHLPEVFTAFRRKTEKECHVRACFDVPHQLAAIEEVELTDVPMLYKQVTPDPRTAWPFSGGEASALSHLKNYIWERELLKSYKETRNGMLGADYSSKLSPWLAMGCISPRYIYHEVKRYELACGGNESTYWLIFELLWRDYFRFVAHKHGNNLFKPEGIQRLVLPWKKNAAHFELWRMGKTGYPMVDANMQELLLTGFMSNRGRQNVASFLTKNLGVYWIWGAMWFQSQLIDYDVCSNYGNWNYAAGIGNDARGFRYFNILHQAKEYDKEGNYVRYWLPALAKLPGYRAHEPYALKAEEASLYAFRPGVDYIKPMVNLEASAKVQEREYKRATNTT